MPAKRFSPDIPLFVLVTLTNFAAGLIWYQASTALFDAAIWLNELALFKEEDDEEYDEVDGDEEEDDVDDDYELLSRIEQRLRAIQRQQKRVK